MGNSFINTVTNWIMKNKSIFFLLLLFSFHRTLRICVTLVYKLSYKYLLYVNTKKYWKSLYSFFMWNFFYMTCHWKCLLSIICINFDFPWTVCQNNRWGWVFFLRLVIENVSKPSFVKNRWNFIEILTIMLWWGPKGQYNKWNIFNNIENTCYGPHPLVILV